MAEVRKTTAGFTLIEVLVALAISALITCLVWCCFDASFRCWKRSAGSLKAEEEARLVLARLSDELREARKAKSSGNIVTVSQGSGIKELIFYSDVNGDSKPEEVHYGICQDGSFRRCVLDPLNSCYPYSYKTPDPWTTWGSALLTSSVTIDYANSSFTSTTGNFGPLVEATLVLKGDGVPCTISVKVQVRSRREAI